MPNTAGLSDEPGGAGVPGPDDASGEPDLPDLPEEPSVSPDGGRTLRAIALPAMPSAHGAPLTCLAWARRRGRLLLATGGYDNLVRLWEVAAGDHLNPLGGPLPREPDTVLGVDWTEYEGHLLLASSSRDGMVRTWELGDDDQFRPFGGPLTPGTVPVLTARWTRLGNHLSLVVGGRDGGLTWWDTFNSSSFPHRTGQRLAHEAAVASVAWAVRDDRVLLATGGHDGKVLVEDASNGPGPPRRRLVSTHPAAISSVAWAARGDRLFLAAGAFDGKVLLWTLTEGRSLEPLGVPHPASDAALSCLAWASYGDRLLLATAGDDACARLWEIDAAGQLVPLGAPLTGHTGAVSSLAWARHGDRLLLATGSEDRSVRLWEVVLEHSVTRLPRYRSDALEEGDDLARTDEARALAELITARSARPPLAVGLFGDWGEGKSHFLRLLQHQVDAVATTDNPLAYRWVRQIRFNAWHYAETALWASLVAELFAQLTTPVKGDDPREAQRSMSRLTADMVADRQVRERLEGAVDRQEKLEHALQTPERWDRLSAERRRRLAEIVGSESLASRLYGQTAGDFATVKGRLVVLAHDMRGLGLRALLLTASVTAVIVLGVLFAVPAGSGLKKVLAFCMPVLSVATLWHTRYRKDRKDIMGVLDTVHEFAEAQRSSLRTRADVAAAEVKALREELQNVTAAGQLAGMIGDRAATADYRSRLGVMTQIREDFQRMADLLVSASESADPGAPAAGGPRVGNRRGGPRAAASGGDGGGAGPDRDEAGDELPRINRIVLYIDDLDRCPPARVVEMLEVIHLLLAVDLFVVVVAIDPRWLLRAVAAHHRAMLGGYGDASDGTYGRSPDAEDPSPSTPAQYLEKIFQIVLTLPPLDRQGYQRMLRSAVDVGSAADEAARSAPTDGSLPRQRAAPVAPLTTPASGPEREGAGAVAPGVAGQAADEAGEADEDDGEPYGPRVRTLRTAERVSPLTLDPDEIALLDLLGPPWLVRTPRQVKRLANSYGLLSALRRVHRLNDLAMTPGAAECVGFAERSELDEFGDAVLTAGPRPTAPEAAVPGPVASEDAASGSAQHGYRPYRAGMVLLAALVAFPALGPGLCLYLHHEAGARPDRPWVDFCRGLRPCQDEESGGWSNSAEGRLGPEQVRQWSTLHEALLHVTGDAAARGLHLPGRLGPWREWVLPVARLSFPAGRVIGTLQRPRRDNAT
ncbi:P-loop NTPase fold protein [Streptomyces sp. NPDC004031]